MLHACLSVALASFVGTAASAQAAGRPLLGELRQLLPSGGWDCLADYDGDGVPDLLRLNYLSFDVSSLELLFGDGEGHFVPSNARPLVLASSSVISGDVDGDGDQDAVLACFPAISTQSAELLLWRNDGSGGFTLETADVNSAPHVLLLDALEDFDGDGALDLLARDGDARTPRLYAGDPTGLVWTDVSAGLPVNGRVWNDVVTGDVDGDGDGDIVAATDQGGQLLENQGAFVFVQSGAGGGLGQDQATAVAVGDLDGNGLLDAVFGRSVDQTGPTRDALFLQTGSGTFVDVSTLLPARSAGVVTRDVELGDLDGDGRLDVLLAHTAPLDAGPTDRLVALRNAGTAGLVDETAAWLPAGTQSVWVRALDLEGDGDLDLVSIFDKAHLLLNDGSGRLSAADPRHPTAGGLLVAIGDWDGDGDLDVVLGGGPDGLAGPYGISPATWRNDGSGVFEGLERIVVTAEFSQGGTSDVDGDGILDLVVANPLRVLLGDGSGGFVEDAARVSGTPPTPYEVGLADLDGDGDLDALSVGFYTFGTGNQIHANEGGVLVPRGVVPQGLAMTDPAFGDLDGDGDTDVLLRAGSGSAPVARWRNDGGLRLVDDSAGLPIPPGTGDARYPRPVLGDVDGDGDLDVYMPTFGGSFLFVSHVDWLWEGDGLGGFVDRSDRLADVAGLTWSGALGDVDEDGDLDVVARDMFSTVHPAGSSIRIESNDGSGNFLLSPGRIVPSFTPFFPSPDGWLADFDGDLDLDVFQDTGLVSNLLRQTAVSSIPRLGRELTLEVFGEGGRPYVLAVSGGRAFVPAGALGTLQLDLAQLLFLQGGALPPAGELGVIFDLPNDSTLVGTTFYGQSAVGVPLRLTNLEVGTVIGG